MPRGGANATPEADERPGASIFAGIPATLAAAAFLDTSDRRRYTISVQQSARDCFCVPGPLAQLAEQATLNRLVAGSSPAWPTR